MHEMKFSTMQLPSVTEPLGRTNFIMEPSGGDLGALVLGDHSLDLYCRSGKAMVLVPQRQIGATAGQSPCPTTILTTASSVQQMGTCSYRLIHSSTLRSRRDKLATSQ